MKSRVLREAEQEIDEAASYYFRVAPGVVGRLFAEVDGALERRSEHPLAYASVNRRFRGCAIYRLPYTVTLPVRSCYAKPKHGFRRVHCYQRIRFLIGFGPDQRAMARTRLRQLSGSTIGDAGIWT